MGNWVVLQGCAFGKHIPLLFSIYSKNKGGGGGGATSAQQAPCVKALVIQIKWNDLFKLRMSKKGYREKALEQFHIFWCFCYITKTFLMKFHFI